MEHYGAYTQPVCESLLLNACNNYYCYMYMGPSALLVGPLPVVFVWPMNGWASSESEFLGISSNRTT